jgi:ribosomal protein L30E
MKHPIDNAVKTNAFVLDYISEFSIINKKKPKAIIIRKSKISAITINNLPERASMEYLQGSIQNRDSLNAGTINGVLCIYYLNEIGKNEIKHKDVIQRLQKKAMKIDKLVIGGKEILIHNNMVEWQPSLEIHYYLELKEKVIINYEDRTERSMPFSLD